MKKIFSFLLAASVMMSLLPQSVLAGGEAEFSVIAGSDFNSSDSIPVGFADSIGTALIDTETYADDLLHKNVVKLEGSSTGYPKLTCSFSNIEPEGANLYAETEFDMLTYGLKSAGAHITLGMANKVKSIYMQNGGKMYAGTSTSGALLGEADMTDGWMHFKFVMQLTDANGEKVNRILGIYHDGELVADGNGDDFNFNESYAKYNAFSIQLSKKSGDYGLYIDNFAIRTYNSETGESPIPDKKNYGVSLVELTNKLESSKTELEDEEYNGFKTRIDSLFEIYSNMLATQTQVSAADSEAEALFDEITEAVKQEIAVPVGCKTVAVNNFDGSTEIPTGFAANADGVAEIDSETYADDILYKNVLNINGSSSSYNYASYSFTPVEATGKNVYVETEFDLNKYGMSEAQANLTIRFGSKLINMYVRSSGTGGIYLGENTEGEKIAESTGNAEWARYRFVFRLTDENGNAVNKLVGIYENGVNVMVNPQNTYGFIQQNAYSSVSFNLSKKSGTYGIMVDNLAITKYSSDDGTSPIPHKSELMKSITDVSELISQYAAGNENDKLDEFNTRFENIVNAYKTPLASTEAVAEAMIQAQTLKTELDELVDEPVVSGGDYVLRGFENFDGGNSNVTLLDSRGLASIENASDNMFLGNYIKYRNSSDTTVYPSISFDFDATPSNKANGAAPGTYTETSFDFKTEMTSGKNLTFYFRSGKTNFLTIVLSGTALNLNEYSGKNLANIPSEGWVNLKFVMQMTDTAGEDVRKLIGIYVNGKNLLEEPVPFTGGTVYDGMGMNMSNLKSSDAADLYFGSLIDNFCVTSYTSIDGTSYAPNRTQLVVKGQELLTKIDTYFSEDIKYSEMKSVIDECAAVYKDLTADKSVVDAAVEKLNLLDKRITALISMAQTKENVYMYDAEISDEILKELDEVTVSVTAVTSPSKSFNGKLIGVLFGQSDIVYGGEVKDIISSDISLTADSISDVELKFDLSSFSNFEKEYMHIKVFAVSDLGSLTYVNNKVNSFFDTTPAFEADNYNFTNEVNASMKFIDDTTQKLIITVNAGKENAGGIAMASVLAQGKTFTESDILTNTEFISQSTINENGYAVFELIPASGNGSYSFKVNADGMKTPYTSVISYYDAQSVNAAFDAVYATTTEAELNKYTDELYVDTILYEAAKKNGSNITEILKTVLSKKRYNALTVDEFAQNFNSSMTLISGIKGASSVDVVEKLIDTYANLTEYESRLNSVDKNRLYKINTYIYEHRSNVVGITTLNSVISEAFTTTGSSNSGGGSSGGGGGGGSSAGGSVGITSAGSAAPSSSAPPVEKMTSVFNDLDSVEWAKQAIFSLAAIDCISGKSQGVFAPDDAVTREEFVKMAVVAFGCYDNGAVSSFTDVGADAWYSSYIASAVNAGIIKGIDTDKFGVGSLITRQDIAVIIHRILESKGKGITEDGVYIEFNDEFRFADYARDAIIDLAKSSIVNGVGGNEFMPEANATRAEAAKMLYEAYIRL